MHFEAIGLEEMGPVEEDSRPVTSDDFEKGLHELELCRLDTLDGGLRHCFVNLNLENIGLTSLRSLERFSFLKHINISGNKLRSLFWLNNLPNLTHLQASNNDITSIDYFNSTSSLISVDLCGNKLTKIGQWNIFPKLQHLDLGYNQIEDLEEGLKSLFHLKDLTLTNNRLKSLKGLEGLNIQNLDASNNQLENIHALSYLTSLVYINLSNNCITSLASSIQPDLHQRLQQLILSQNMLPNVEELFFLKSLSHLEVLNVQNNPKIDTQPYYQEKLLYRLQQLQYLNGNRISPERIVQVRSIYGEELQQKKLIWEQIMQHPFVDNRLLTEEMIRESEKRINFNPN